VLPGATAATWFGLACEAAPRSDSRLLVRGLKEFDRIAERIFEQDLRAADSSWDLTTGQPEREQA
jgi:hypothetical protein